jgi:hypothetical protein
VERRLVVEADRVGERGRDVLARERLRAPRGEDDEDTLVADRRRLRARSGLRPEGGEDGEQDDPSHARETYIARAA